MMNFHTQVWQGVYVILSAAKDLRSWHRDSARYADPSLRSGWHGGGGRHFPV